VRERRVDLAFVTLAAANGDTAHLTGDALEGGQVAAPAAASYDGLQTRPLLDMPLRLLVHRDHPLARKARLTLRDLAGVRYIALRNTTAGVFVRRQLAAAGHPIEVAQTVEVPATAILYVELGLGETFVPAMQVAALGSRRLLRALPVAGLPRTPLGWATLDFSLLPEVAVELLDEADRATRKWRATPSLAT
jgi:DNA-binding transcriptional LysR family regulator